LGPDHPSTLTCMDNLARGYHAAGNLDLALPLYEETLKLKKAKLGPDHLSTLTTMHNLAEGYKVADNLDLALPLFEETLKRMKAKLGPDHHETLTTMNNLAASYWRARKLTQSIPLFEEGLKLQEKKLGRSHPETQLTVANLGVNYKDADHLNEALPLLEEAYRASRTIPNLHWVGAQLLAGYAQSGKATEAVGLTNELVAEARKTLPKESAQLAGTLAQYGFTLLQVKSFTDAELLLRECLAIREKQQPVAWPTFNTQSLLGHALLGQQKYADAEPLLLKGYEGLKEREKTIPPQAKDRIPEALDRLIDLYTATDKPDEVKKWQADRGEVSRNQTGRQQMKQGKWLPPGL
ncbi:MAG TPA: tetratricopeptide repeat-containing protein, partial [Pirellulales bacterium]|nr:tetratricopeptide repeat-containing protein [Pirellulales bacterium]